MYFIVYKTTNLINGMIYVGMHRTENLNDGYLGSGLIFKEAVLKYGRDNFLREILFQCENAEQMYHMEATIVNEEFIRRKDTYNIQVGGIGGAKDARNTSYYKSGDHIKNIQSAQLLSIQVTQNKAKDRIKKYCLNPSICNNCKNDLPYEKRKHKFCNKSCSAIFNNTGRVLSEQTKLKISGALITPIGQQKKLLSRATQLKRDERIKFIRSITPNYRGWVMDVSRYTQLQPGAIKGFIFKYMKDEYFKYYP